MFAHTLLGFTFSVFWAIIVLFIWIAFAFWPARVAGRKGYSFIGFFILSLFLFVIALIIAYAMPSRVKQSSSQSQPEDSE
jgi:hypothetical protein